MSREKEAKYTWFADIIYVWLRTFFVWLQKMVEIGPICGIWPRTEKEFCMYIPHRIDTGRQKERKEWRGEPWRDVDWMKVIYYRIRRRLPISITVVC